MFARTALGGIWVYQNYLSARKGYRCAYSVLHGGTGCSGYAKQTIRDAGLFAALQPIRARFQACKAAHVAMQSADDDDSDAQKPRQKWSNWCDLPCQCAPSLPCSNGGAASSSAPNGSGCDVGGCNVDLCDCGPSSACDACSCS